jgi:hypothetical protein
MAEPLTTAPSSIAPASQDLLGFLKQYEPAKNAVSLKDILPAQFRIDIGKTLPQWSAPLSPAFQTTDETQAGKSFHALLCPTGLPLRLKAIQILKDFRHPNLMTLVASGLVDIPQMGETRYALIYETPNAKSLATIIKERKSTFTDRIIMTDVITPLADILKRFEDAGIAHGRLNLDNIYFGDRLIVGDCLSEPCGFSQTTIFEPLERVLASPLGKGEADSNADCYAVGMLALHLASGATTLTKLDSPQYIEQVLKLGAYNVLMQDREFSNILQDFLRGTLNEKIAERWGTKLIQSWLGGKRFNLIPPSPPREATRSFSFLEEDYASRKALAHALFTHWDDAPDVLKEGKLARWLELSLHKPALAEALHRISKSAGEAVTPTPRQMNEIITRTIALLDPDGPIRMGSVQVRVEGIGSMLADLFMQKKQKELQAIADIIENDIPNFWADLHKDDLLPEVSTALWRIQRVRLWMRQTVIGAGMERCLYDLNPTLACQSPHIARFCPLDLSALLYALDSVSKEKGADSEVLDRHSGAFIASKLDMQKDLKIHELQTMPSLVTHPKLISLKLLIAAQEKTGLLKLRGLSAWVAHRIMPLLDNIHNRKARSLAQTNLAKAASSGDLRQISALVFSDGLFRSDSSRFEDAARNFYAYQNKIEELRSEENLASQSERNGYFIAQLFAIFACIAVATLTFQHHW